MMKLKKKIIKFIFLYITLIIMSGASALYAVSLSTNTFICEAVIYNLAPSVLTFNPMVNLEMLRNNLDIIVIVGEDGSIDNADIHYGMNLDTSTWTTAKMTIKNLGGGMWELSFPIPGGEINSVGNIYYYIEIYDNSGAIVNISSVTVSVTDRKMETFGSDGGKMTIMDGNTQDGESYINFPSGCMGNGTNIIMIQRSNDYTIDAPNSQGDMLSRRPVTLYSIGEAPNATHLTFTKPVTVCLLYRDLDGDGNLDDCPDFKDERYLKAFYYDGYDWRLLGGVVDMEKNTVTFRTTHFSTFALFPTRLTADMYRPKERIITPALKDGINDVATFDGLNDEGSIIKIYDVLGRLVRTIKDIPYEWDGKDEYGNIVENGVYIYQFKADVEGKKKLISGTIAVAK
jgi:hypothetical protein